MPTTHVIVTFTKATIFINEEENKRLTTVGADEWFRYGNGQLIKGSAVAEILTLEKYYWRNPDKRPEERKTFKSPRVEYVTLEDLALANRHRARGLSQGLKRFCEENPTAVKAHELYCQKRAMFAERFTS